MQETPKSLIWLRFTAEPRTGRFITRDSYRGERENADTWHLYAYCANNPINYVDPSRHYAQAVYMGYKTYRVAKSVAAVGAFITSPAGTLLVITAVLGVVVYHGAKYYKAKAVQQIKSLLKSL